MVVEDNEVGGGEILVTLYWKITRGGGDVCRLLLEDKKGRGIFVIWRWKITRGGGDIRHMVLEADYGVGK